MPNHLHLLLACKNNKETQNNQVKWGICLRSVARKHGRGPIWERSPRAHLIPDQHHLLRQLRYVHLNPCRAKLVGDPGVWTWSTHRDLIGLTDAAWLDQPGLSQTLDIPENKLAARLQRYITGDPSVHISGVPLPRDENQWRKASPAQILKAAQTIILGRSRKEKALILSVTSSICGEQPQPRSWDNLARYLGVPKQTLHHAWKRAPQISTHLIRALKLQIAMNSKNSRR